MPYRLSVTAGPSLDLSTHKPVDVNNDDSPVEIYSSHFRGRIIVRIKNLPEDHAPTSESRYFNNKSATFSLQCQGVLKPFSHIGTLDPHQKFCNVIKTNK